MAPIDALGHVAACRVSPMTPVLRVISPQHRDSVLSTIISIFPFRLAVRVSRVVYPAGVLPSASGGVGGGSLGRLAKIQEDFP